MSVYCSGLFSYRRSKGATGFVVNTVVDDEDVRFIITCHHAIPNETIAKSSSFRFNHIDDQYGASKISGTDLFDMTGSSSSNSKWFWTNKVRTSTK